MNKEFVLKNIKKNLEKVFVFGTDKDYTYQDLYNFICQFTNFLKEQNIQKLLIQLSNNFYSYSIIISCYLAGVTYCCFNFEGPVKRREYIESIFEPDLIISETQEVNNNVMNLSSLLTKLAQFDSQELFIHNTEIIYVYFTSGSTGNPKACKIKATAFEQHIKNDVSLFKITQNDILGQYVPIHFDMSGVDIYCTIMTGASLVQFEKIDKIKPDRKIKKYKITFLNIVPQVINILINNQALNEETLSSIRMIRFGGDKVFTSTAGLLFKIKPELVIVSTYGPTETTMFTTAAIITKENINEYSRNILSIGKPINGSQIYLHNIEDNIGEIVIYGDYIGAGYLGNDQDGYKYCEIDGKYQNVYFTGDFGSKHNDLFYFEGRNDQQIKFNGNRISLVEIETAINKCINSTSAVIFVDNIIVCFIQENEQNIINFESQNTLIDQLKDYLPAYSLPNVFKYIKQIPTNANGKIDYQNLRENYKKDI